MKLRCLSFPFNLLENLNAGVFISYKAAICSVSKANLKIVLLSAIFKIFFPAKGELLVIVLDKKHYAEAYCWRTHIIHHSPARLGCCHFLPSVQSALCRIVIYIQDRL